MDEEAAQLLCLKWRWVLIVALIWSTSGRHSEQGGESTLDVGMQLLLSPVCSSTRPGP